MRVARRVAWIAKLKAVRMADSMVDSVYWLGNFVAVMREKW